MIPEFLICQRWHVSRDSLQLQAPHCIPPWPDPIVITCLLEILKLPLLIGSATKLLGHLCCSPLEFSVMVKDCCNPSLQPLTLCLWIGPLCWRKSHCLSQREKVGKHCLPSALCCSFWEWGDYTVSLQFTCSRCRLTVQPHKRLFPLSSCT